MVYYEAARFTEEPAIPVQEIIKAPEQYPPDVITV
jgi:hypothetical protein